jgi:hypothetical protein
MDEEQREHSDSHDHPCPAGNKWRPEIDRLNSELMSVRNRMDRYEMSQAMVVRDIGEHKAAIEKMATHEIRLDRIEQRGLNTKETWLLFIAAIGSAASLAAVLWK